MFKDLFSAWIYTFLKWVMRRFCWLDKNSSEVFKNTRGGVNATLNIVQIEDFLGTANLSKTGRGGRGVYASFGLCPK